MKKEFSINPPLLHDWLTTERKEKSVILIGLNLDWCSKDELIIDLDVIFNFVYLSSFRNSLGLIEYFTIGCSSALIEINSIGGNLIEYSNESTISVNNTITGSRIRSSTISLSPEISVESGNLNLSNKLLSIDREAMEEYSWSGSFNCQERIITIIKQNDSIKWILKLPKGKRVTWDFILGNLPRMAKFKFKGEMTGEIIVKPLDLHFYNSDNEPVSKEKYILMSLVLWMKGRSLKDKDGIRITFTEKS